LTFELVVTVALLLRSFFHESFGFKIERQLDVDPGNVNGCGAPAELHAFPLSNRVQFTSEDLGQDIFEDYKKGDKFPQ
jgi:hypothetical protein